MKKSDISLAYNSSGISFFGSFVILICLSLWTGDSISQEVGYRTLRSFPPDDYNAHNQNWAILQGKNGLMYFGNNRCLLEYDGATWRKIKVPKDMAVRSLGMDNSGKIFIGGQGDFGFLQIDERGMMQFKSLLDKTDEKDRDFYDVWNIRVINNDVYFMSIKKIFRYRNNKIKAWSSPNNGFIFSCILNNQYYFQERPLGLFRITDDSVTLVSSFQLFKKNKIRFILPLSNNNKVILSTDPYVGLLKCDFSRLIGADDRTFSRQITQADTILEKNVIYRGIKLRDGKFAFGTLGGGAVITDETGRLVRQINSESGLQNDKVYDLFQDREANLWLALNSGISRVDIGSPLTYWDKEHNFKNIGFGIVRFDNTTYILGTDGLNYIKNNNILQIKPGEEAIAGFCFLIYINPEDTTKKTFLIGSSTYGLFKLKDNNVIPIYNFGSPVYSLCQSKKFPSRVFVGTNSGLSTIVYKNNTWKFEGNVSGINNDIRSIEEDIEGNIWLGTQMSGVIKIVPSESILKPGKVIQYYTADGLPVSVNYWVRSFKRDIIILTQKGLFRYDSATKSFMHDCRILPELCDSTCAINDLEEDKSGKIWISFDKIDSVTGLIRGYVGIAIPRNNGNYSWIDMPFKNMKNSFGSIFFESDSAIWMGGKEIYFFNGNLNLTIPSFPCLVRKVSIGEDSVIFNGNTYNRSGSFPGNKKLPYKFNSLAFEYAALSYYDETANEYQVRLEGFDKEWSKWTGEHRKIYNNLNEGNYKFRMRAKNLYDKISHEDVYEFRIMPPWYRSYPAYILYLTILVLIIFFAVRLNTRRLREANLRLDRIVKDRTAEIERQRDVVISQKNHIEKINSEITDSIKYARYIQSSILPKEDQLESALGEHFVLFRPKDIVSGDFYWVSRVENMVIAAVADCTGHGVPGAFMSMLGAAFLNEIINKEYITHPGVILRRLRKEVIKSMQQRGEMGEQQDGMDIALCSIDYTNMKLQFAGANNPLYLIRKSEIKTAGETRNESGDYRLYEIKGDHMPIGIYYKMDNFTLHEIDIFKGDIFYMFSDGFADQFGGSEGKKFGYKTFREHLLKCNSESMKDQKKFLENTHESWIGPNQQIDDIIIMGFKI